MAAGGRNKFFSQLLGGEKKEDDPFKVPTKPAKDAKGEVITLTPNVFDRQFSGKREIRTKVMNLPKKD